MRRNPFYVTADEGGLGVYLVLASENNKMFFLSMRISHIAVLRNLEMDYLIIDHDPQNGDENVIV